MLPIIVADISATMLNDMETKMRHSKLLVALLFTIQTIFAGGWIELPCTSTLPGIRLEANNTSIRVSRGQELLAVEELCDASNNLAERIILEVRRTRGMYTVAPFEGGESLY